MFVQLNTSGQFGPDGPQEGAQGDAVQLVTDEYGDAMLAVFFDGFERLYWVSLDHVLHPGESSFGGGTTRPL